MRFTAEEKLDCAVRELKFRKRVFPRLIEQGRMTQEKATKELALMEEIIADYRIQVESGMLAL